VSSGRPELRRAVGLVALTLFGLGDILGAGVYGLIGQIAGMVGYAAWTAYAVAGVMAALTGLTYAEFASRYPKAGGAAHYCEAAFRFPPLTFMVIYLVALSGLFSMATSSRVFADYALRSLPQAVSWARPVALPLLFVAMLTAVAARGITISSLANALCTIIEVLGLLAILAVGARFVGSVDYLQFAAQPADAGGAGMAAGLAALSGASLAFFSFVGFEDMVNLSEETRDPERTVPKAVCLAILLAGAVYGAIAIIAVSVLPPEALKATKTPLLDVVAKASPGFPLWVYSFIPAFAVFNTALLNLIMASRLLYGMARQPSKLVPSSFAYVHARWQTPVVGLAVSAVVVAGLLVVLGDVRTLASGTASFLLAVFVLLHVGLIVVKRNPSAPKPPFCAPAWTPWVGAVTGLALLARQDAAALKAAGVLALAGVALYAVNWAVRGRAANVRAVD